MASPAHELDVCFLHGGDDDHGECLPPLRVIEESDDDCTRQMRSDMSAAKQVDPSAFKPDVQIKLPEEVPVCRTECQIQKTVGHRNLRHLSCPLHVGS